MKILHEPLTVRQVLSQLPGKSGFEADSVRHSRESGNPWNRVGHAVPWASPALQTLRYASAPKFERRARAYDSRSCLRIRLGRRTHTANKIMNATAPSTNSIAVVTSGSFAIA